jgi:membrane associated rhomboid family serine protease
MIPFRTSVIAHASPAATMTLIVLNIAVFFVQQDLSPAHEQRFVFSYALVPALLADPDLAQRLGLPFNGPLPLLTNTFMHGGYLHLIVNMWTLWLFGVAVEDRLGSWRFLGFYLVCGIAGSAAHFAFNALSQVPALGASGAVAGLLGGFARLFPRAKVAVLQPIFILPLIFQVPALVFTVIWFALQLVNSLADWSLGPDAGGIAWWAHMGGFAAGLAMAAPVARRPPRPGPWSR